MSTKFLSPGWRMPRNANQSKQSNYSMDFDGSSQYIDCGESVLHTSNATVFTLSAWIKPKAGMSLGIIAADAPAASPTNGGFWIGYDNRNTATRPANGISYNIKTSTGYQSGKSNDNVITLNVWNHIVLVLDGQATLYVNGVSSTNRLSDNIGDLVTQSHELLLGTEDTLSFEFNGQINQVSIFDYALSPGQVTTLWGGGTSVSNPMALPSPPIAYYPLGTSAWNGQYLAENNAIGDYVFDFIPNDYIDLGNNVFFNTNNPFSFSTWVNLDSYSDPYPYLANLKTNVTDGIGIFISNNSSYSGVNVGSTDSSITKGKTTGDISGTFLNSWNQVVVTYNGNGANTLSNFLIYVNGSPVTLTSTGTFGTMPNTANNIGRRSNSYHYLDGKISNVQIFNTSLSGTEVTTLYNNGSPIRTLASIPQNSNLKAWYKLDASEVYNSSTTEWEVNEATSPWTSSLDFDSASSDYIDCGASSFSGETEISVSAWVYPTATGTGAAEAVLSTEKTSSTSRGFYLSLFIGNEFRWQVSTDGSSKDSLDSGTILLNQWSHVAATWNQSTMSLYVNGSLVDTINTVNATGTFTTTNNIFIAKRDSSAGFFPGSISNASIWNTDLTSAQVTELYNEGLPSDLNSHSAYSNLVSWWQLGENSSFATNWICVDEKGSNNGDGQNMGVDALVNGVGTTANGVSSGMSEGSLVGDAPYSTANALSSGMSVVSRVTGSGNTP